MKLGDKINTYEPTVALKLEEGTFRVNTPGGENLYVQCEPGELPRIVQWNDGMGSGKVFTITKITETGTNATVHNVQPFERQATG
jgi:hypothetical protein